MVQGAFIGEDLLKYKPAPDDPDHLSLRELAKINPDVRGWLTLDDTHIDYPLVQGEDNLEYINKDVKGEFSLSGAVFLNSENQSDFSDFYNIIYGHHMDNGAMFGDIEKFQKEPFFKEHRDGTLVTLEGKSYGLEIFACLTCDAYDKTIYRDVTETGAADGGELVNMVRDRAAQFREPNLQEGDRLTLLSTCADARTNGRIVLICRMYEQS